jgi:hypothetical protein
LKSAISQRFDDLISVAQKLQAVLDQEDGKRPLPGMLLARLAATVDEAAAALERHAEGLATQQAQRRRPDQQL